MKEGVGSALMAATLFGASTPVAKLMIGNVEPVFLAGMLYAGSGLGLGLWVALRPWVARPATRSSFAPGDYPWLAGAVLSGGVLGPSLFMIGLAGTPASATSLLLNLEGVLTALLAWFAFRENFGGRVLLGMALIVCGGLLLGFQPGDMGLSWPAGAIALACLCWAFDNNFTRRISTADPALIAAIKGAAAGTIILTITIALGVTVPTPAHVAEAALVGFLGYGVSLVLFVVALRELGTARTGAYFSTAPFIGAALSFAFLNESPAPAFWIAGGLMACGVLLHLTESHDHVHGHEALRHEHGHSHDAHHQHGHDVSWDGSEPHVHEHSHEPVRHVHAHFPDIHHRHGH